MQFLFLSAGAVAVVVLFSNLHKVLSQTIRGLSEDATHKHARAQAV